MTEIRPIPSIPGAYANSLGMIKLPDTKAKMPHGGIREYKTKWISGCRRRATKAAKHEYFGMTYRGKNYKIHRLVCEAFHGPAPFKRAVVIHVDEDATNNRPENLRWGTMKENMNMPKIKAYHRAMCQQKMAGETCPE